MKNFFVYIMANKPHGTLYTGVTSNLQKRVLEHKSKHFPHSFTAKYNCNRLVWYEEQGLYEKAFTREKQIKGGTRAKKIALIEALNATWDDLSKDW